MRSLCVCFQLSKERRDLLLEERQLGEKKKKKKMGKGGISQNKDGEGENMAAWLLGVNNLKIQPFNLPSLG